MKRSPGEEITEQKLIKMMTTSRGQRTPRKELHTGFRSSPATYLLKKQTHWEALKRGKEKLRTCQVFSAIP